MENYICELLTIFTTVFGLAFLYTLAIAYSFKKKLIILLNRNHFVNIPNSFIVTSYPRDIESNITINGINNNRTMLNTFAILPNSTAIAA
jgi:hypothetical protein